jgi:prefoldin subunit 5
MFNLFKKNSTAEVLRARIQELQADYDRLFRERMELKTELEDLKLKRKTEEEDIKHMVRMKEERMAVDLEKKTVAIERERDATIAKVKDEYRDKMEKQLSEETKNIKEMYGQILQRLPNVNVKLTGSAG